MEQWVNRLWNNIFVNPLSLLLSVCEISGPLYLLQLGLTASCLAGWQADEVQVNSKFSKLAVG